MLEAAISLLRQTGLSGAGINEVVRESGAPKGSLYYYFPGGKEELVAEALALYATRVRDFLDATLSGSKAPAAKIRALFEAFAHRIEDAHFQTSCAAGAVTLDLVADLEPLRNSVDAAFSSWVKTIAAHFRSRNARAANSFAGLVVSAIEGAYIRSRAAQSAHPFREAGRWLSELAAATFETA
jgi:TetR/AcrR family transcriptional regulator, lmrAB and yxaGH operons repressor